MNLQLNQIWSGLHTSKLDSSVAYLYDSTISGYRAATPSDFQASISLTGASLNVGSVGVTGGYIGISGTPNVNVTNAVTIAGGQVGISGGFIGISGTVQTNGFQSLPSRFTTEGSGQLTGSSFVVKNGPGTFFKIFGYNNYTGSYYIHLCDNAIDASSIFHTLKIGGEDNFYLDLGDRGTNLSTGLFIAKSSDPFANSGVNFATKITAYYQ